ncbi:MAG TPA: hypothetical protein VIF12_01200 [Micavibrio sp.]|jgi:hypothetical protein
MKVIGDQIKAIMHPYISSMYLKKDFGNSKAGEDVLVIDTEFPSEEEGTHKSFDSYLVDLLIDLEELKNQAEREVGRFDRVDIRTH